MSKLSDDRVSTLARQALEAARKGGKVLDERRALNESKRVIAEQFQLEDQLDSVVRAKIPRHVTPGSQEWDIFYRRTMEEEVRKHRR
jgi:hypothetical protein